MSANLAEQFSRLPDLLAAHMLLVAAALAAGAAISLPLGILCARSPRLRGPAVGFASTIQTVPALALLALMVPLVGRIGFLPAFLALTLYSMLPMLRNAVVGLAGVDGAVREAARAVGMTPAQSLWKVELPLAAPVILAGVRTATVWVVGMATLATPVGASSLGNYIFSGLQTRNWTAVLFGCVASALLALALDQLLRALESGVARRRPARAAGAAAGFAALILAAIAPALLPASSSAPAAGHAAVASGPAPSLAGRRVTVGGKPFTEQYVLAHLIAGVLEDAGAQVRLREDLGSTIAFDALIRDEIDLYVDYTGTIWASVMNRDDAAGRDAMAVRVAAWLLDQHGVTDLGRLGFENAYGFAVTRAAAQENSLASVADLNRLDGLSIGGDPEFFGRPEWIAARDAYGLQATRTRPMDSTFMYGAVRDGAVDAITAYTTDGRIDAFDLVLLADPAGALPPYDAILLLSPAAGADRALTDALRPLLGAIPPGAMRRANAMVDLEGESPEAAAAFLASEIGISGEPAAP